MSVLEELRKQADILLGDERVQGVKLAIERDAAGWPGALDALIKWVYITGATTAIGLAIEEMRR